MRVYDKSPGMEKTVKTSFGAEVDPRNHFATTYTASFGGFDAPRKPYKPLAASIVLSTTRSPLPPSPTADVKQPTAFTVDVHPFVPFHAKHSPVTPKNWAGDHYTTETRKSFTPKSVADAKQFVAQLTGRSSVEYKDIQVADSSFSGAYQRRVKYRHVQDQPAEKLSMNTLSYRDPKTAEPPVDAKIMTAAATSPTKPTTVIIRTSPKEHPYIHEAVAKADASNKAATKAVERKGTASVAYKDVGIQEDGFTRGLGNTQLPGSTASPTFHPPAASLSVRTNFRRQDPVSVSSVASQALIHPMNPLRSQKVHLFSPAHRYRDNVSDSDISPKVSDRVLEPALYARSGPLPSPREFGHHTSGAVLDTGDQEFLRIRQKHNPQQNYVSEQKAQYTAKKAEPKGLYRDVKIIDSAFTEGYKLQTCPWKPGKAATSKKIWHR